MLVLVLLAFGRAGVAGPRAQLQQLADDLLVVAGPPQSQPARRFADVGAIQAEADALGHVHRLGEAGIGAAGAHLRAVHEVMDGIAERLVDVFARVGVQGDHLANGHVSLLQDDKPVDGLRVPLVTEAFRP